MRLPSGPKAYLLSWSLAARGRGEKARERVLLHVGRALSLLSFPAQKEHSKHLSRHRSGSPARSSAMAYAPSQCVNTSNHRHGCCSLVPSQRSLNDCCCISPFFMVGYSSSFSLSLSYFWALFFDPSRSQPLVNQEVIVLAVDVLSFRCCWAFAVALLSQVALLLGVVNVAGWMRVVSLCARETTPDRFGAKKMARKNRSAAPEMHRSRSPSETLC